MNDIIRYVLMVILLIVIAFSFIGLYKVKALKKKYEDDQTYRP